MTVAEERLWDFKSLINFSRAVSKLIGVGKVFILQVSLCKGILQDIMERSNMKLKKNKVFGWVALVVMGIFAVRLSTNVWRLWRAGDRIKQAESEVRSQELENQELQKRLAEVQSPEFIEREAKEKLGLVKPGEEIVILPTQEQESVRVEEQEEPNWRKWWKLYVSE